MGCENVNNSYKILITGGMGFIGAHLACRLVCEGHTVTLSDIADPLRNTFSPEKRGSCKIRRSRFRSGLGYRPGDFLKNLLMTMIISFMPQLCSASKRLSVNNGKRWTQQFREQETVWTLLSAMKNVRC